MGVGSLLRPGSLGLALRPGSLALQGWRVLLREPLRAPFAVAGVQDGSRHSDQTDEDKARRRAEAQSSGALSVTARIPRTSAMNVRLAVLQDPLPQAGTTKRGRRRRGVVLATGREGCRDQVGV